MSFTRNIAVQFVVLVAIVFGFSVVGSPSARADTDWKCNTWNSFWFGDSGFCTEVVYRRKDMGSWCKAKIDWVGVRTTDNWRSYNDPAARIYSLDLQNASGRFLFGRDDVAVANDSPHAHRGWDKPGTWNGKSVRITSDVGLRLKSERDKRATTWFTVGPFTKNCKNID